MADGQATTTPQQPLATLPPDIASLTRAFTPVQFPPAVSPAQMDENTVMQQVSAIPDKEQQIIRGTGLGLSPMISKENDDAQLVPPSQVTAAQQSGYRHATLMRNTKGELHLVGNDEVQDAVNNDWTVNRATPSPAPYVPKPQPPQMREMMGLTSGPEAPAAAQLLNPGEIIRTLGNKYALPWLQANAQQNLAEEQRELNKAVGPESATTSLPAQAAYTALAPVHRAAALTSSVIGAGLTDRNAQAAIAAGMADPAIPLAYFGAQGFQGATGIGTGGKGSVREAWENPTPENWSKALTDLGMMFGAAEGARPGTVPLPSEVGMRAPITPEAAGEAPGIGQAPVDTGYGASLGLFGRGVSKAVSPVTGMLQRVWDPEALSATQAATKAFRPRNAKAQWQEEIARSLPIMRRSADAMGIDVNDMTPDEALQATDDAARESWAEYKRNHLGPNADVTVNTQPVADAMRATIDNTMREQDPGLAAEIERIAKTFDNREMSIGEVQDRVSTLNNQTRNIEAKYPRDRAAAKIAPENEYLFAQRDTLRGLMDEQLNQLTGPGAAELRKNYGALRSVQDVIQRRLNVVDRGAREPLAAIMAKAYAAGHIATALLSGHPLGALGGVLTMAAERRARALQDPNYLTGLAFQKTQPAAPWSPTTPEGPRAPTTAEQVGARAQQLAGAQQQAIPFAEGPLFGIQQTPAARTGPPYEMPPSSEPAPPEQGQLPPAPAQRALPGGPPEQRLLPAQGTEPRVLPRTGPFAMPPSVLGPQAPALGPARLPERQISPTPGFEAPTAPSASAEQHLVQQEAAKGRGPVDITAPLEGGEGGLLQRPMVRPQEEEARQLDLGLNLPPRAEPFYSKAEQVAEAKLPQSGPGDSFLATLRNNGVKAEEISDLGINEFAGRPKVTKQEFLDAIRSRRPQLDQTALAQGPQIREGDVPGTSYEDYATPGGSNYREVLTQYPQSEVGQRADALLERLRERDRDLRNLTSVQSTTPAGRHEFQRSQATIQAEMDWLKNQLNQLNTQNPNADFQSAHWQDYPNVLAHTRESDFTTTDGMPVRHVQEWQSDLHQRGRERGYRPDNPQGAPNAPFKKSWPELMVKDSIRRAIDDGAQGMTWDTGATQADRYDLAKRIERIEYDPYTESLTAWDHKGARVIDENAKPEELPNYVGKEMAAKLQRQMDVYSPVNEDAYTIGEDPHEEGTYRVLQYDEPVAEGLTWREAERERQYQIEAETEANPLPGLSGLDLRVGGEGMSGFYDKIIPDFIKKYVKKWGAKVDTAELPGEHPTEPTTTVHRLTFTPQMIDAIKSEGQPLYSQGLAGSAPDTQQALEAQSTKTNRVSAAARAQNTLQALRDMNTRVDEGSATQAAAIHLDDAAAAALQNMGIGGGGPWKGVNLDVGRAQRIAQALRDRANAAEQLPGGVTAGADVVRNMRTLADQIDRVASLNYDPSAGHAGVPLVHDPGSFAHEVETHGGQRAFAGGQGDVRNFTDAAKVMSHPAAVKGRETLLNSGYPDQPAVLAVEMEAHILDGHFEDLGLTREEAVDFMKHSQRVLAEHHGPDVMLSPPRLAQRYLQSIDRFIGGPGGETGATATAEAAQPGGTAGGYGENVRAGETLAGGGGGGNRTPSPAGAAEVGPSEPLAARSLKQQQAYDKQAEAKRISARKPTSDKAPENSLTSDLRIDADAIRKAGLTDKVANVVRNYPGVRGAIRDLGLGKDSESVLAAFQQHLIDNYLFLHDNYPAEFRDQSVKWYDGANDIETRQWPKLYGTTDMQNGGGMAAISPKLDWNKNIGIQQRVIEALKQQNEMRFTPAMQTKAKEWMRDDPTSAPLVRKLMGRKLGDLQDPLQKALWIHIYQEAEGDPNYTMYAPDGTKVGIARTQNGKGPEAQLGWTMDGNVAKAVSIFENPSRENIDAKLGDAHKIRQFYNNKIAPNSPAGDTVSDTHHVAAGLMRPLGMKAEEVGHNFSGPPTSTIHGVNGTYGLYADANRAAAAQRDLKSRQMQSIVWDNARALFPAKYKTTANNDIISGIWRDYDSGKITNADDARQAIVDAAGGWKPPDWATYGRGEPGSRSYPGRNVSAGTAAQSRNVPAPAVSRAEAGPQSTVGGRRVNAPAAVPAVTGGIPQTGRSAGPRAGRGGAAVASSPIPPQLKRLMKK